MSEQHDHWYEVSGANDAREVERGYYDEQFIRGARQGITVSVDGVEHHFVPAYTLALNGGQQALSYGLGDDGAFHVLTHDGRPVRDFPQHDWFEIRERRRRERD